MKGFVGSLSMGVLNLALLATSPGCGGDEIQPPDVRFPGGTDTEVTGASEGNGGAVGALRISRIVPAAGAPGSRVMIFGSGFSPGDTRVFFGRIEAEEISIFGQAPSSTLIARVPDTGTSGPIDVTLVSAEDEAIFAERKEGFTVLAPSGGSFRLSESFEILPQQNHFACEFGDFNQDGYPDLVYVRDGGDVGIYPNRGEAQPGAFAQPVLLPNPSGLTNITVNAGDLDMDGFIDLIVLKGEESQDILYNDGTGDFSFTEGAEFPKNDPQCTNGTPVQSGNRGTLADFNGDGFLDFFQAQGTGATGGFPNQLFFNDHQSSPRTFKNVSCANMSNDYGRDLTNDGIAVDYDLDGDTDLFTISTTEGGAAASRLYLNTLGVLRSESAFLGNFDAEGQMPTALGGAWGFLDDNDYPDVVLVGSGEDQIFFNSTTDTDGDGVVNLAPVPLVDGGQLGRRVLALDFDGDGDQDLFVGGQGEGTNFLKIYLNDGGTFTDRSEDLIPREGPTASGQAGGLAAADVDRDGDLDIAVCTVGNSTFLLLNE